jgi:hypothetical protein
MSAEKVITAVRLVLPAECGSKLQAWLGPDRVEVRGHRLAYTAYGRSTDGNRQLVISIVQRGPENPQAVSIAAEWARDWFVVNHVVSRTIGAGITEGSARVIIR